MLLALFAAQWGVAQQISQWRSGLTEINEGWATHAGDDLRWAQANFDDSDWARVDIEDIGPAQAGWRWFRKSETVSPDREVHLLLQGGDGIYELYVDGVRQEGAGFLSELAVRRPVEHVFPLVRGKNSFTLAIRTRVPVSYSQYGLPFVIGMTMGNPVAIGYERKALESERLYQVIPSIAINSALCLAGIGAFMLFAWQRSHREYLFLGVFLLLSGLSDGLVGCQLTGVVPTSIGVLFADPLTFLFCIAQIEFTFAFVGLPVGVGWRICEVLLLCPLVLVPLVWTGHCPYAAYELVEQLASVPVVALPVLLLVCWRRGNREAALLVIPSVMPAATGIAFGLGSAAIYLHWTSLQFLADPILIGPIPIVLFDIGTLPFLLAIGFVMFFRFTRVSREQARAAAELNAAREIQQRLVPASLPAVPGFSIDTAYMPAQEVGGDFYQVLAQPDCSTLIVVGDVSGKGLKAAMTGALAIGAIRTLSTDCLMPAVFLARLNQQLVCSQETGFVTCLCARVLANGEITIANAGHLAPYRNGGEVAIESGLPLGIISGAEYVESTIQLDPEDNLTLLSDGVLEARDAAGELFGFDRTRAVSDQSAGQIAAAAQAFGQEDDITVLTVRFAPASVLQA